MTKILKFCSVITLSVQLAACGGGGSSPGDGVPDLPEARPAPQGLLKRASSEAELAASLRTGLQGASYTSSASEILVINDLNSGEANPAAAGSQRFSTTNLQETGVDEADLVKYDGEVLYAVDFGNPDIFPFTDVLQVDEELPLDSTELVDPGSFVPQPPVIRIFRTQPDTATAQAVAQVSMGQAAYSIDGLYLRENQQGKQMLAIGQTNSFVYWELFASDYYWRNGRTVVQAWNVDNPEQPQSAWSVAIDGSLLTSRRIDNTLYLVSRYSPNINGLIAYPNNAADIAANRSLIESTPVQSLLPKRYDASGNSTSLVAPDACYIRNENYAGQILPPGGGSLITVTAIDLDAPDSISSICLNTFASGFYASTESLYVTANTGNDTTLIHKIALLDSGPEYRGSGKVPGYLGTSNPSFLMSESNGDLRVLSSSWQTRFFPLPVIELQDGTAGVADDPPENEDFGRHRLTVLRESDDGTELAQLAQLPNAQRPSPIGKPDEEVRAVRFLGDRAYVVTFEVIDPFYVLDLSDAEDPLIAGELEIPGFSTLLQPVGENLILGIGYEVAAVDLALVQGVKLELFDVGNIAAPISLDQVVIGKRGSYSPALDNHHALTTLERDGVFRVALPIDRYEENRESNGGPDDPWFHYGWSDSGLYLFDVAPAAGAIVERGSLIVEQSSEQQPWPTQSIHGSRSVLDDEAVFFVNYGAVDGMFWGESVVLPPE